MNTPAEAVVEKVESESMIKSLKTAAKYFTYAVIAWVVVVVAYVGYQSVVKLWVPEPETKDTDVPKKRATFDAVPNFDSKDISVNNGKPNTLTDLTSDRTTFDLLQGRYGPAVILLYANWCPHCKTMLGDYSAAATKSKVPFYRVEGQYIEQTAKNFKVQGFPTIYGVDSNGKLVTFQSYRTEAEFLAFANKLVPESNKVVSEAVASESKTADIKTEPNGPTVDIGAGTGLDKIAPKVEVLDTEEDS